MHPGVSLGVLGYPGVSWGNQTDPSTIQNTPSVIIGFMALLCHYLCEMGYFL